jgi:hypothetical protein
VVEAARHVVECSLDFIKQLLYVAAEVPVPQGPRIIHCFLRECPQALQRAWS